MPIPLCLCAEFLLCHYETIDSSQDYLQSILDTLRNLEPFNKLGASFLALYPQENNSSSTSDAEGLDYMGDGER